MARERCCRQIDAALGSQRHLIRRQYGGERRQLRVGALEKEQPVIGHLGECRREFFGPVPDACLAARAEPRAVRKRRVPEGCEQQIMAAFAASDVPVARRASVLEHSIQGRHVGWGRAAGSRAIIRRLIDGRGGTP